MRRAAKTYSIVDHQLLHGGYLQKLSHRALALYLFYVVVGDLEGKSFWSELAIRTQLSLSTVELARARAELTQCQLIRTNGKTVYLKNLEYKDERRPSGASTVSARRKRAQLPANRGADWDRAQEMLKTLLGDVRKAHE